MEGESEEEVDTESVVDIPSLKFDAAYNLSLIYSACGQYQLARKVLMENIIV
jgi:hypothetical protein